MAGARHGGRIVAERIRAAGIHHIFTLCGGHVSPILVQARQAGIHVVDVRHEASAVFAADAMARLTGRPGVAVVTAGPGVTNTITAVKNARMAQSPVLVIGGAAPTLLKNRGSLQDIDQHSLMKSLVKWQACVATLAQLDDAMDYGLKLAAGGVPGPVFIEAPIDLLYPRDIVHNLFTVQTGVDGMKGLAGMMARGAMKAYLAHQAHQPALRWHLDAGSLRRAIAARSAGDRLEEVIQRLESSHRPALVLGSQVLANRTREQAHRIADAVRTLGLPTWTGGMARGLFGRQSELLFRHQRSAALKEADLVIICGFPFDFRLKYGRGFARNAAIVSANLSVEDLTLNRKPTVAVLGHPGDFLCDLTSQAPSPQDTRSEWFARLRRREAERETEIDRLAALEGEGVNPLRFFREMDGVLREDDILVVDGGDFVATSAYTLTPRGPLAWLDPGVYGTLGVGGGFTLGAAMACPESRVWLIYGDGSSAFSLAEFDTFVRMGIAPIAVIGCDARWSQIAREQETMLGSDAGTCLRMTDYQIVAQGYGGHGIRVTDNEGIVPALKEAQAVAERGTPVCINLQLARSDFRKGSISM